MLYPNIKRATFIARPNRFIARILVDGREELAHVKNTGRCRELLLPGSVLLVQQWDNPKRRTNFDVIAVYKGDRLINMDSQIPNRVFAEWVTGSGLFPNITLLRPETTYHHSRFDFYIEAAGRKIFLEVKGVTLEEEGVALFPDAPTERGVKHIHELCDCLREGYEAYLVFIIQLEGVAYFTPNLRTHPAFGEALAQAKAQGVQLLALDCHVTEESITARNFVEIRLG